MSTLLLNLALGAVMATGVPGGTAVPVALRVATDSVQKVSPKTMVEVDNRSFNDATIFLIQGARRQRLGIVNGLGTERFTIPDDIVRSAIPIRFIVRPLISRRSTLSDEVSVYQGDTIELFIPPF